MATRSPAKNVDRQFLWISAALVFTGFLVLASASMPLAQREKEQALYYIVRQFFLGGGAGLLAILVIQLIPLSWIRACALPAFMATVLLLFSVFLPGIGLRSGGATRWIHAGPVAIQPAEIAKITLPLYLAAWFASRNTAPRFRTARKSEKRQQSVPHPFTFLIVLGAIGVPIILQPDLSNFGVLALTALLLYFLADAPLQALVWIFSGGIASFLLLVRIAPYRINRILSFLHPHKDPLGIGYQINQALLAVGSGGVFGRGLGLSREKLFFLPEAIGDSIFAVFAEETGFVGSVLLIALFVFFVWRGFSIARRLPDTFMQLFTAGLVAVIAIQAFLNIAGNLALFPLVGITLPFISYGSASLTVSMAAVGLVLKMSRYVKQ